MQVTLRDVTLAFGRRQVVAGLSAVFPSNAVTALAGPSGSGKSTVLAAIAGHLRPSRGIVEWTSGLDTRIPDPHDTTWIPQSANALPARSVLDNVMLGPLSRGIQDAVAAELARGAIARVGLGRRVLDRAGVLSGGEQQRLAFARGLASTRSLVLADEPSAGLDEANTMAVAELLHSLSHSSTIVIATHDPLLMRAADSVVHLREGTT